MYGYNHYYRPDENGIVILGFTDAETIPEETDFLIGEGPRQFTERIINDRFQYVLKIVGGVVVGRSQAELDEEWGDGPQPSKTPDQLMIEALQAQIGIMFMQIASIQEGIG